MKNTVILVKGHKWNALYVNGELRDQNYTIPDTTINQYLEEGGNYRIFHVHEDWLANIGYFPEEYKYVWFQGEKWK